MRTSRAGIHKDTYKVPAHALSFLLLLTTLLSLIPRSGAVHPSPSPPTTASVDHTLLQHSNPDHVTPHIHAVHAYAGALLIPPLPHRVQDHPETEKCTPILNQQTLQRREVETVVLVRRKSVGAKIRAAFHKAGGKIKHAFQSAGHAIVHVAQKVGHFIKTTGKKIAKVGLKIAATVGKVVGKAIGFIPGAKGISKAIEGGSEGLNKASDSIHAHIGGKLGQSMNRMDKAQKYVGYIP